MFSFAFKLSSSHHTLIVGVYANAKWFCGNVKCCSLFGIEVHQNGTQNSIWNPLILHFNFVFRFLCSNTIGDANNRQRNTKLDLISAIAWLITCFGSSLQKQNVCWKVEWFHVNHDKFILDSNFFFFTHFKGLYTKHTPINFDYVTHRKFVIGDTLLCECFVYVFTAAVAISNFFYSISLHRRSCTLCKITDLFAINLFCFSFHLSKINNVCVSVCEYCKTNIKLGAIIAFPIDEVCCPKLQFNRVNLNRLDEPSMCTQ